MNDMPAVNAQYPSLLHSRGIAINHVGYEAGGSKVAVLAPGDGPHFTGVKLRDTGTAKTVFQCQPGPVESPDNWGRRYQCVEFSDFIGVGRFVLEADGLVSEPFVIAEKIYAEQFPPAILSYFQSQREGEPYTSADKAVPFIGNKRNSKADVHGGWYDASGDVSKYLSHLSYANFMNPQQTPLVVWALAKAAVCDHIEPRLRPAFRAEALYGADFLVRMCDPAGMFYMTVFDRWSGDTAQREISSYSTQKGHKHDTWEAGYRQGGGMAIAALARVARLKHAGEYPAEKYLETAERAFAHLEAHNLDYLDDGKENIIDDYCALLAAIELTRATDKPVHREAARKRATALLNRLTAEGWWRADDGTRPFFHAAEEGMPICALVDYLAIASDTEKVAIVAAITQAVQHILKIGGEVPNPFAYPRQLVKQSDSAIGTQFFYPHGNESGYWWQGENARLASLAYAFRRAALHTDPVTGSIARRAGQRMIDWILGANPFHSCMLQGFGRNWSVYAVAKYPNADGGICNGITSSLSDEHGIAFCETEDPMQSWRWSEQWLPHAAWFLLAMTEY